MLKMSVRMGITGRETQILPQVQTILKNQPLFSLSMITDHEFRNQCAVDCEYCNKDPKNMCSHIDSEFRTCFKTRAEHITNPL